MVQNAKCRGIFHKAAKIYGKSTPSFNLLVSYLNPNALITGEWFAIL